MPLFGRRLPWESQQVVTIALRAVVYRITLRLPTAVELNEYFFPNAIGTDDGKIERLQLLGFYNRPLDYDFARGGPGYSKADCLRVGAFYYRRFYGLAPDADITATLNQKILEFWLNNGTAGGVLPADGAFARLQIPAGHNVYWPKGCAEAERDLFGSGGASRYEIETRFHAANILLGKIPIVVQVERKDANTPWGPAPIGVEVALSLIKPAKDLPKNNYVTPPAPRRGTLEERDGKTGVVTKAAAKGDLGPWKYLKDRVADYVPGRNGDPQKRNVHWSLGGKRDMHATSACASKPVRGNVFPLVGVFGARHVAPRDGAPGLPHTVLADTDDRGLAVVMFAPSRIGGDRYRLQAQIGPATRTLDGEKSNNVRKTGTMVLWRNIRVLHHIRVEPPTGTGDIDPTLAADLHTGDWTCLHNAHISGRICIACLRREETSTGQLDWVDFTGQAKKEFAKAYCELEVDPTIKGGTYDKMSDVAMTGALDRAIAVVQANATVNSFDNTGESPLCFAIGDGVTTDFGSRKVATKFQAGSVKLMVSTAAGGGWKLLALHNTVSGAAAAPPAVDAAASSYNPTTKTLVVTFVSAVDATWQLQVENQRPDGTVEKVKLDPVNLALDRLSLTQVMDIELRAGFKIQIAGVTVGSDQAPSYIKNMIVAQPIPAYTSAHAGTKASITFAKKTVVAIRFTTAIPDGVEVKVYGNADVGGGGYANGVVLFRGTGAIEPSYKDIPVDGICKLDATWIRVGDEVVAKSNKDGKLVGVPGATATVHGQCSVKPGSPAQAKITFPAPVLGTEDFRIFGGGAGPDDVFLAEHAFAVTAGATTVTVDLPKDVKRCEAKLRLGTVDIADDELRLVTADTAGAFALRAATITTATGTIAIEFTAAPPVGTRIGVQFICHELFCDLPHLFYHPTAGKKTPFFFNLHPSWAYNALKGDTFGPLPMTSVHSGEKKTAVDGTEQSFAMPRTLRHNAMRVDIGSVIWGRANSGLSGQPAMSRFGPGIAAEFDINAPEGRTLVIKQKAPFVAGTEFTLHYQSMETKALKRTAWADYIDGDGQHAMESSIIGWTAKMLTAVLTEFFRQIHTNSTFIPGLIFVQAALYDTLSCTYAGGAQVGLAQGPGSFLTGSKMFKKPSTYAHPTESEDGVQPGNTLVIGIHEICHSLYIQHAPSAGGNYPEDHDIADACLMSYSNSMTDFCGQCLVSLRGMNYKDGRLTTATHDGNAVVYAGSDHWAAQAVGS